MKNSYEEHLIMKMNIYMLVQWNPDKVKHLGTVKKLLTLSKVDFIQFQGRKAKYP